MPFKPAVFLDWATSTGFVPSRNVAVLWLIAVPSGPLSQEFAPSGTEPPPATTAAVRPPTCNFASGK
jgi:hypothetical protein